MTYLNKYKLLKMAQHVVNSDTVTNGGAVYRGEESEIT
jgi:hypothetical protein